MVRVFALSAYLFAALPGPVAAQLWKVEILDTGVSVTEISRSPKGLAVGSDNGDWRLLRVTGDNVEFGGKVSMVQPRPLGALPDGKAVCGRGHIARAWFGDGTGRYRHGILGDEVEAAALVVETVDGKQLQYTLGRESVFEDLRPRLADLNGDGRDEIIVIRSYLDAGAALAVFGVENGQIIHIAETPPIGRPNRWLNPAGFADFDGDGRIETAVVVTPHIGGILQLWRLEGGELIRTDSARGFSNHAIGSRILDMSVTGDFDGDGIADLALPSAGRNALRIVSFDHGLKVIADIPLPHRITGGVASESGKIIAVLGIGRLAVFSRGPK